MTVVQYVEHAYALAHAFHVQLVLARDVDPGKAGADVRAKSKKQPVEVKTVYAKTITDDTSYIVVLHEMGHCCAPLGALQHQLNLTAPGANSTWDDAFRYLDVQIESEEAAWTWARHYALEWTVGMEQVEQQAMGTYLNARERFRTAYNIIQGRRRRP
jgi:hypothetical protein